MQLVQQFDGVWATGKMHQYSTHTLVTLVLKRENSPSPLESYSPIVLISCEGKLLERRVLARLNGYLGSNFLLPHELAGSWPGRSTSDCIAGNLLRWKMLVLLVTLPSPSLILNGRLTLWHTMLSFVCRLRHVGISGFMMRYF